MTQITERQSISAEEVDRELLDRMFDINSKELPKTTNPVDTQPKPREVRNRKTITNI